MIFNLAKFFNEIISFVKENSAFMTSLYDNTLHEYEESKKLHASTIEVDAAAKKVIENSNTQAEFLQKIMEWSNKMRVLGEDVADNLKALKSLSDKLEERSNEMKTILANQDT